MIRDNDARDAAGIQTINEGASDEARRAGYEKAACRAQQTLLATRWT